MLDERSSKASRSVIVIFIGGIIYLLGFFFMIFVGFDVLSNGYHTPRYAETPLVLIVDFLTIYAISPEEPKTVDSILNARFIQAAVLGSIAGLHFIIAKQVSSGKIQNRIMIYAFIIFDSLVILALVFALFFGLYPGFHSVSH
jgi:hypothetical protein